METVLYTSKSRKIIYTRKSRGGGGGGDTTLLLAQAILCGMGLYKGTLEIGGISLNQDTMYGLTHAVTYRSVQNHPCNKGTSFNQDKTELRLHIRGLEQKAHVQINTCGEGGSHH